MAASSAATSSQVATGAMAPTIHPAMGGAPAGGGATVEGAEACPRWRRLARAVAVASLLAIVGASLARLAGALGAGAFHAVSNAATLSWFVSAPLWLTPGLFGLAGAGRSASPS